MRSGANDQERIPEMSLVQNGGFIKARGLDQWTGRSCCPRACEGWLIIYLGVERVLRIAYSLMKFGSKVSKTLRGLVLLGKGHLLQSNKL